MAKKLGRPRKDPDVAICHGIMVQPRFPRAFHRKLKLAAKSAGLPMTRWIRERCEEALAEK